MIIDMIAVVALLLAALLFAGPAQWGKRANGGLAVAIYALLGFGVTVIVL